MAEERRGEHQDVTGHSGMPGWVTVVIVILGIVAIGGIVWAWQDSTSLASARQAMSTDLSNTKQSLGQDISALKDRLTQAEQANQGLQSDLGVVTKKLRITQGQLKQAREEAEQMANQVRDDATQKISALDTSVHGELAGKASADDLKATNGQVGEVRTDLNTTKNDLQMARSELGTLIAKNHEEVEELRRLGERDYVEFTIAGRNKPQKVGNVTVELRGANEKRNLYSLAITVDDKRVERRDRGINEPIFFYPHGTHQPEEIVINKVGRNAVTGYLSIPKANQGAASGGE